MAVNDADAAFHLRFGRETFATFAGDFEIGILRFMDVIFHMASRVKDCG